MTPSQPLASAIQIRSFAEHSLHNHWFCVPLCSFTLDLCILGGPRCAFVLVPHGNAGGCFYLYSRIWRQEKGKRGAQFVVCLSGSASTLSIKLSTIWLHVTSVSKMPLGESSRFLQRAEDGRHDTQTCCRRILIRPAVLLMPHYRRIIFIVSMTINGLLIMPFLHRQTYSQQPQYIYISIGRSTFQFGCKCRTLMFPPESQSRKGDKAQSSRTSAVKWQTQGWVWCSE